MMIVTINLKAPDFIKQLKLKALTEGYDNQIIIYIFAVIDDYEYSVHL